MLSLSLSFCVYVIGEVIAKEGRYVQGLHILAKGAATFKFKDSKLKKHHNSPKNQQFESILSVNIVQLSPSDQPSEPMALIQTLTQTSTHVTFW